jgi:hypothetical protein
LAGIINYVRAIIIEQGLKKLLRAGHKASDLEPALVQHLLNRHEIRAQNNELLHRLQKVNRKAVRDALVDAQEFLADLELHDLVVCACRWQAHGCIFYTEASV